MYPWLEEPLAQFASAFRRGRLPGSVIIAGNSGFGTMDLALECAKLYLCHESGVRACGACRSCAVFEAAAHPDFTIAVSSTAEECNDEEDLTRDPGFLALIDSASASRRAVRVDTIRRLNHWLYESPALGHSKAAIIHDAHTMGESAANAALKTFEEPPPHTLIIMVVDSLEEMLPTILSRALKLQLKTLDRSVALNWLTENTGLELSRCAVALDLCHDAPLSAAALLQENLDLAALDVVRRLIAVLNGTGSSQAVTAALKPLSPAFHGTFWSVLALQILKFKAGYPLERLSLIHVEGAQALLRMPGDTLFELPAELPFITAHQPLIPSRAPESLSTALVERLTGSAGLTLHRGGAR